MTRLRPCLAILFALVLTLTGHTMAVARGANDATGQMELCIGAATVVVYTDATGTPTTAPHLCPECLAASLMAVLPASSDVPVSPVWAVEIERSDRPNPSLASRFSYLSRAPPHLV